MKHMEKYKVQMKDVLKSIVKTMIFIDLKFIN